ncbi:MAG TPA: cytochrome c oxidase subunit II [Pyrinomonadaceae bacterium]|jgi:cytochrome c oxidase subunit 2|nr:cytochrome c oxidase subunit II [Pyrinomonadaceae bacterium]
MKGFAPSLLYSQSVLDTAGPQAGRIESLWWLMFWVELGVFVVVMGFLLAAVLRRRRPHRGEAVDAPDLKPEPARERRMSHLVIGGVAVSILIQFVFLVASYLTGDAVTSAMAKEHLTVKVTGRQWWWEATYENSVAQYTLTTANEIHIPVGVPVLFKLASTDVIHSFWVPQLHGKTDLIPGHETILWLRADKPGAYRGQCAEFCGYQHAHMGLVVVAEPPEQFKAWYDSQLGPAREPSTASEARGREIFVTAPCVMCHTIQGTEAGGRVGPNLTHVASRQTIAAGTLENTRGHLAGWVTDSQKIKPGNRMPPVPLAPDDLQAVLDYLQSLK